MRRLDPWPYLQIERRTDGVTFRVRDLVVGTLNFATRVVSVNVPPGMVRLLLDGHPQLSVTHDGVSLNVIDTECGIAAEQLLCAGGSISSDLPTSCAPRRLSAHK